MIKKSDLRKSELFFIFLGLILVSVSIVTLTLNISFLSRDHSNESDPFETTYTTANIPPQAPEGLPTSTATPSPAITEIEKKMTPLETPTVTSPAQALKDLQKVFLLSPASHSFIKSSGNNRNAYPLKLKFEVEPKNTPSTLVVTHADTIVLSKELSGSPSGIYEVSILVKKLGLYRWQVTTKQGKSELREFVIKAE